MPRLNVLEITPFESLGGDLIKIILPKKNFIVPGMRILNDRGDQWLVTGVLSSMVYKDPVVNAKSPILEDLGKGIWNCLVKPINHTQVINVGDIMTLEKRS